MKEPTPFHLKRTERKEKLSDPRTEFFESRLQKMHDKYIKKLDELIEAKNKEIMTV